MQVPAFQDILEISPKDNPTKSHISINYIKPETFIGLGHGYKGFY